MFWVMFNTSISMLFISLFWMVSRLLMCLLLSDILVSLYLNREFVDLCSCSKKCLPSWPAHSTRYFAFDSKTQFSITKISLPFMTVVSFIELLRSHWHLFNLCLESRAFSSKNKYWFSKNNISWEIKLSQWMDIKMMPLTLWANNQWKHTDKF